MKKMPGIVAAFALCACVNTANSKEFERISPYLDELRVYISKDREGAFLGASGRGRGILKFFNCAELDAMHRELSHSPHTSERLKRNLETIRKGIKQGCKPGFAAFKV